MNAKTVELCAGEGVSGVSEGRTEQSLPDINSKHCETMFCLLVCLISVAAFFAMGTVVGASMLDRLWLLGGLLMAWWASGAVHRDTRGGK